MKIVTESFSLPCSVDTFWRVFFDADYGRALYLEQFGFKAYRLLEKSDTARKLYISPRVNLPGPLAKLVGDAFAYEEHGTFDRAQNLWSWKMVTSGKALVTTSGTIRLAADGEGRSRRSDEVRIEGKVFGIGGLIESTVERELHSSWAKEQAFLRTWIAKSSA